MIAYRLASLAALVPAVGLRKGLEYRRLVRRQARDRVERVYDSIWRDAASELGSEMASSEEGTFTFRKDGRAATVLNWRTSLKKGEAISLDKPEVDRRLAAISIPVPVHLEISAYELGAAMRFLAQHGGPCVVKPAARSGGYGVTCGVRTRRDLVQALIAARAYGRRLMVEREIPGDVYRLLFLDGVLLDVLRRHPSRVTGDGESTVLELIAAENRRRVDARGFAGFHLIRPDLDCMLALRAAAMGPRSVPEPGLRFSVKSSTGDSGASDTETVAVPLDPALVEVASAAVRAVGARFAGVDLVTQDLGRDLRSSGGAIIEVNVPPGIHFHYLVAVPESATRVAVPVLRSLLERTTSG